MSASNFTVVINGCRIRSGGGVVHCVNVLKFINNVLKHNEKVICFCSEELREKLSELDFDKRIELVCAPGGLIGSLLWEALVLPKIYKNFRADVLLNLDAGSLCRVENMVTICQDLLAFEAKASKSFPLLSKSRLRIWCLRHVQLFCLRRSSAVIFLHEYAQQILASYASIKVWKTIPHGVDRLRFRAHTLDAEVSTLIYVSDFFAYKNHEVILRGVANLISDPDTERDINLILVGGGQPSLKQKLTKRAAEFGLADSVTFFNFLSRDDFRDVLNKADVFVFASSCENLPITLIEGMALGLPILCSNRGPMPAVLKDGGVYFDPEDVGSFVDAFRLIEQNALLRTRLSHNASNLANQYSWETCGKDTWEFVKKVGLVHGERRNKI